MIVIRKIIIKYFNHGVVKHLLFLYNRIVIETVLFLRGDIFMSEQSSSSNGGIRSKFQERLHKIKLSRSKKYLQNQQFIQDKVQEIRKAVHKDVVLNDKKIHPKGIEKGKEGKVDTVRQVIVNIRATSQDRNYKIKKVGMKDCPPRQSISLGKSKNSNVHDELLDKGVVLSKAKLDTQAIEKKEDKEKENKVGLKKSVAKGKKYKGDGYEDKKEELLKEKGLEILEKLKESFEDKLDELEVLESELYFLRKDQENELELKKVKEIKKKIDELVEQVNNLIEQHNLYAKNYYIDHVIGIDDAVIVDDIIEYREMLDSFLDEKKFVKEYKALEEFKKLHGQLKSVRDDTNKLIQDNQKKIEEYDIRDKKYNDIKLGVVGVREMNRKCSLEIEQQNQYFSELMKKINHINREEYTTYHLRGIGELITQSLRYMGIMMVTPLTGLLPGIGMQAIATRRMIGNIYRNMHVEEVNHVHYDAINYDSELNHHLCEVDYTEVLLEDTLRDINRLKNDFMLQYDSRIPGYEDTLKTIEKMEDKILHNQNKVEIIKKNLKISKKINENKMIRVRKLNQE